jgi:hypothetical protein
LGESIPRASFNTTCDLVYGPSGAIPNAVYASGPCRVVPELYEIPLQVPLSARVVYITLDFAVPNGPGISVAAPIYTFDYDFADTIVVPSGGSTTYEVLFVEQVDYLGHPTYWRAHCRSFV